MFYRQKENKIISKILDHSGGVFSSGHGWGILGGRQGKTGYGKIEILLHPGSGEKALGTTVIKNSQQEPMQRLPATITATQRVMYSILLAVVNMIVRTALKSFGQEKTL
jgi:hypothetical protein